jgi:2-oxoisovalerate dehydrogenase E2 component (dihydrolipoyl transacylase)
MARFDFRLPDVGEGIAEAEIVQWHVSVGDFVNEDQALVDVMTDKATVEITAPVSGRILSLNGEIGRPSAVGSTIVVFELEGGDPAHAVDEPGVSEAPISVTPERTAVAEPDFKPSERLDSPASGDFKPHEPARRPLASPSVRKRALDLGVHLQLVGGSGPAGRVVHEDLDAFMAGARPAANPANPAAANPVYAKREGREEVRVMGLRRKIAQRMLEAKRRIPHFSYIEEVEVGELELLRAYMNERRKPDQPKLTFLPFFIRALVKVLLDFPELNATFDDVEEIVTRHAPVHLGMATQTPAGLMVAVIRHAEALDVWSLAKEISRLADAARRGTASRDELSGSTITVTSLGPLGGLAHTPIINMPEVAIVGPNRIVERPIIRNGQIVSAKIMNLSSSFDHRVVEGHTAASFIKALKAVLERPTAIFID